MKIEFYPKLALDGIRKNKRMYLPYLLTCIGMVGVTYIINFLQTAQTIAALKGGESIQMIMNFGGYILTFFSALFLFYTNSFLIRRRKKEFGLYHVLGMGKKNIARIVFWETVFIAVFSIGAGLFVGIAVSKLAELGLVNILEGEISYSLDVSAAGIIFTAVSFLLIFLLLFLNSLRQIWFSNAISLLRSENTGEKPPKGNWLFGLCGFVILGAAYYLAVTINDPLSALTVFFIAVVMVIAATYLIMVSGSVLLCRFLQKNKRYYYKKNHFVSVSSMAYRMKRNGAGLASICILATMVLVMISSTSTLFIGEEQVLTGRYPREVNCRFWFTDVGEMNDDNLEMLRGEAAGLVKAHGGEETNIIDYRTASIAGLLNGGDVIFDKNSVDHFNSETYSDLVQIYLVPLEDYNAMTGRNLSLASDEALTCAFRTDFDGKSFSFRNGRHYTVKEQLSEGIVNSDMAMDIIPSLMVVVPDLEEAIEGLVYETGDMMVNLKWNYYFDTTLDNEEGLALREEMSETFQRLQLEGNDFFSSSVEAREENRKDFYAMYGGMFYLGALLSIVLIFAAVLIIYYKQISEGYEDQARFEIMQKVGMTKKDIRKSINSQLLTVFFLPLAGAGLHLAFAFPIIEKLLLLFNLNNRPLFICTTLGSFLVFALFYVIVYRITAGAYYQIVSGSKRGE